MGYPKKLILEEYSRSSKYRIIANAKGDNSSSSDSSSDVESSDSFTSSSDVDAISSENDSSSTSERSNTRGRHSNSTGHSNSSADSNSMDGEVQAEEEEEFDNFYDANDVDDEREIYFDADSDLLSESENSTDSSSSSEIDSSSDEESSTDYSSSEESSSDESDEEIFENADTPLYAGAPITVGESIISILKLATRFTISGALLSYILDLIAMHCIQPNNCVKTIYKLKKIFSAINAPIRRHYYCNTCYSNIQDNICPQCNNDDNISYFLQIPLTEQLAKFYKRAEFRNNLAYRFYRPKENNDNYEDIYDGSIYNSLPNHFTANQNNITFMWNTDGVPLFKSSKICIWPFYLIINELPYKLRVKKENVLLAGLWIGTEKPCSNLFMGAFMTEFENLYRGVDFEIPGSDDPWRVRALTIAGTCDLCAKALFMNIKQYNSIYGCPNCKIRTEAYQRVRVYPMIENLELRSTAESRVFAAEALQAGESVYGVKGPTTLDMIAYNYVESTAIDEMHNVFLGPTKKLLSFWFDPENRVHGFSLFTFINIVNARIKNLTLPSFIPRIPRSVSDYAHWKASELVIFLLIFSLSVLAGVMTAEYFEHHMLLVQAITLLNLPSISEAMILEATRLLREYLSRFEYLYGMRYMTCNLHLFLHLPDMVRKFGPLYIMSCFSFEHFNGILKRYVHGSRHPQLQICSAVSTFLSMAEVQDRILRPGSQAWRFCRKVDKSGTLRCKIRHLYDSVYAVGAFLKTRLVPEPILNALRHLIGHEENIDLTKLHVFHRLLKDGRYYETELYVRQKKTNSSFVKYIYNNNVCYGVLHYFLIVCKCECKSKCTECNETCKTYAIIARCDVQGAFLSNFTQNYLPNIYTCTKYNDDLRAVNVNAILQLCFFFNVQDISYVVIPTYLSENVIK